MLLNLKKNIHVVQEKLYVVYFSAKYRYSCNFHIMEGLWGSSPCYHLARVTMERKKQHTQRLESQWEERDNIINSSTESKWEERDNIISARWLDNSFFCTACPKSSGATRKHVGLDVSHHKLVVGCMCPMI